METMRENLWAVIIGVFLLASVLFIGTFGDDAIQQREQDRYEQPVCRIWGEA